MKERGWKREGERERQRWWKREGEREGGGGVRVEERG